MSRNPLVRAPRACLRNLIRSALLTALAGATCLVVFPLTNKAAAQGAGATEGLLGRPGVRSSDGLLAAPRGQRQEATDEAVEVPTRGAQAPARRARVSVDRVVPGQCTTVRPLRTLPPETAVRLAWCLMDADRPMQAAPAFAHAYEFGDAATRQEAAYGRTLALLRKTVTDQAGVSATDAPQSRQRNAEVGANILEQRALAAFRDERYVETIFHLDERARLAPEQGDLLVLRAYAHLRAGQSDDAARIFRALERAGNPEGAAGRNAVDEAIGLVRGGG